MECMWRAKQGGIEAQMKIFMETVVCLREKERGRGEMWYKRVDEMKFSFGILDIRRARAGNELGQS